VAGRIRHPDDATHDIQVAFRDVDDELIAIARLAEQASRQTEASAVEIKRVEDSLNQRIDAPTHLDHRDVMRGAGDGHAIGYVPDPGPTLDTTKFLRHDGAWEPISGAAVDHGSLGGLGGDDHTHYLLADGTRALTGNWDAGSFQIRAETLRSDVATGTAPLTIASTTLVTNLNSDQLDGQEGSYYLDSANFTGTDWTDLTDAGDTTLHGHDITGLTGYSNDHGALDGLADDDHTQYLLVNGTRDMTGDLLPNATGTLDLGATTDYWAESYVNLMYVGTRVEGQLANLELRAPSGNVQLSLGGTYTWSASSTGFYPSGAGDADIGTNSLPIRDLYIADQVISSVATGTAPLTIASTTLVSNLNADLLDGQEGSYYLDLTNATNQSAIDHTSISNIGTQSHAAIDSHIIDTSIHFAQTGIDHGTIGGLTDDDHTQYTLISSQAGTPSSTPSRVGLINVDTSAETAYVSTGTASSADWDLIETGGSVDHGGLLGLGDDDHTQYFLADGSRDLTGDLVMKTGNTIYAYGEYTDASNYGRAYFEATVASAAIGFETAGTGDDKPLVIKNESNGLMSFHTNNTMKWLIEAGGDFEPGADDTYDIGASSWQVADVWTTGLKSDGYIDKNENSHFIDLPLRAPDGRIVTVEDDFVHGGPLVSGDIGTLNWNISGGTGYTVGYGSGTNNGHPGLVRIKPDNDTGDAVYLFANYTTYTMFNGIEEYWQTWILYDAQSTEGEVNIIVGINTTVDYAAGTDGIYFYCDYNANNNWQARTIASGSATDTDTGVAHRSGDSANDYFRFDIHYTPTAVKFYIDGSLVATNTTNIPTSDAMMPALAVECDATGAGNSLENVFLDYYAMTYKVDR